MISLRSKVTRSSRPGLARVLRRISGMDGRQHFVGVLPEDFDNPSGSGSTTIGVVALANEFGLKVPRRSYLRSTFLDQRKAWSALANSRLRGLLRGAVTADQVAITLGKQMKEDVQRKIFDLKVPRNADSTVAAKGSDNPLIDSGTLLNTIKWAVEKDGRRLGSG